MQRSEQLDQLAAALAKAQGQMTAAVRTATNPHLRNKYATLADLWDACRKPLASNGLSIAQSCDGRDDQGVTLSTLLLHTSGQWLCGTVRVPLEKPTAQALGSAVTYARRYALAAMVGVTVDDGTDDDGTAAVAFPSGVNARPAESVRPVVVPPWGPAPACPKCGGDMWDNRPKKAAGDYKPTASDFKCKKPSCGHSIFPPKSTATDTVPAKIQQAFGTFDEVPPALQEEADDDLPFV